MAVPAILVLSFLATIISLTSVSLTFLVLPHVHRALDGPDFHKVLGPIAGSVLLLVFGRFADVAMALDVGGPMVALVNVLMSATTLALSAIVFLHLSTLRQSAASDNRALASQDPVTLKPEPTVDGSLLDSRNNGLDLSVAQQAEQLEATKRRFEVALAGTNIAVAEQDTDLRYLWIHNPPGGLTVEEFIGKRPEEFMVRSTVDKLAVAKQRVLKSGRPETVDVEIELGGTARWFEERIEPIFADNGVDVKGIITVAVEVTSHKQYERHLEYLLREITHRSKNLLAIVQAIARKTGETVETSAEFIARFGPRLQALATAHDMLIGQSWQGIELRDLILRELAGYGPDIEDRVTISGESEVLGMEAVQHLALGFFEMASNAAEHGALSVPGGSVAIAWQRQTSEDGDILELTWTERGGPNVQPPARNGFGRAMIERLVPRAVDGTSKLIFDSTGLHWILRIPVHRLANAN